MVYFLIIILQMIGIALHVMQKVVQLDDKHPEHKPKQVLSIFLHKDWDTLIISAIILILNVVGHFVVSREIPSVEDIQYYNLYSYGIALILGYGGQRLVYKLLGKAEATLSKKIDDH